MVFRRLHVTCGEKPPPGRASVRSWPRSRHAPRWRRASRFESSSDRRTFRSLLFRSVHPTRSPSGSRCRRRRLGRALAAPSANHDENASHDIRKQISYYSRISWEGADACFEVGQQLGREVAQGPCRGPRSEGWRRNRPHGFARGAQSASEKSILERNSSLGWPSSTCVRRKDIDSIATRPTSGERVLGHSSSTRSSPARNNKSLAARSCPEASSASRCSTRSSSDDPPWPRPTFANGGDLMLAPSG